MTQNELCILQCASVDSCNPDSLSDISTISVDRSQPVPQRMTDSWEAIGAPGRGGGQSEFQSQR